MKHRIELFVDIDVAGIAQACIVADKLLNTIARAPEYFNELTGFEITDIYVSEEDDEV